MKLLLRITHFLPADVRLFTLHRAYFAQNYNFLKEKCHGDSCAVTCTWVSRLGEICFKIRYVILGSLWRLTVRTMVARLFAFISILREEEDLWKIRKGNYAENTKVHTKQPPSWKMWVLLQCAEPDNLSNLFWIFYISYLNGCWYEWI